ncbi:adenosylcobinamide-phosphate synthase CbiB [Sphingomonas sp. CJ20]
MLDRGELVLATLIAEAAIGYPAALFAAIGHPVSWVGALIRGIERRWNHGAAARRRVAGVALLGVLVAVAGALGWGVQWLCGGGWGQLAVIAVATTGLAQRSLYDHVRAVALPLRAGDVEGARAAVSRIVGRDTAKLDEGGIATAAIESLAESFCDGVLAPAFWFLIGGLPGLFVCKAISTADSMVGHRTARFEAFGWTSARADDAVNYIPARIAGVLLCIAGAGGWRTMWRDAPHHASPNGGWPEGAMAGALGRRLGGRVAYDGEPSRRAVLGRGPVPDARDLDRGLRMYLRACLLLWIGVGGVAWLL